VRGSFKTFFDQIRTHIKLLKAKNLQRFFQGSC